jgi:hypothetical protein
MRPATTFLPLVLAGGLLLGACGSDGGSTDTGASAGSDATATTSAAADAASRVSANDASREEIAAAIDAAGVDSAERWAGEVVEYRPYAAGDEARLREELAKYGPSDATIDQILSVLTIP